MTTSAPITMAWDGEAMHPAGKFWAHKADEAFVIGETYRIVEHNDRSTNSHNHFFASLQSGWENLPEIYAEQFPTSEHLRRYALIKSGFCDSQTLVCESRAAALRTAAFMRPLDEFALVTIRDVVVTVYRAKSQSRKAMGKEDFQKSKDAVLDIVSDLIGVRKDALAEAGKAA